MMTVLDDLMSELQSQLRNRIATWAYPESRYFEVATAGDPIPRSDWAVMIEESSQAYGQNAQQTSADIAIEVSWVTPAEAMDRFIFHSSLDEDGMQRAVWNLRDPFDRLPRIEGNSDVLYTTIEPTEGEALEVAMRTVSLRWEYDFADAREYPAPDSPAILPVLPASLSDVWGIKIFDDENILYLTEGSPTSAAEADVHSFDLSASPPSRRSEEISAGVASDDFHRGLDGFGDFLYNVSDEGSRGSWALQKINRKRNVLTATRSLGEGNFTGCWVFADGAMVGVSEHYGAGTRYHIFNTSDLSPVAGDNLDVLFGSAAGGVDIGEYAYDIIGSTAVCVQGESLIRRLELDIDLGGFRIQWRDATVWASKKSIVVSGVESTADGTVGILRAFGLPAEVAAVLD